MVSSASRPLPVRMRPDITTERQSYQGRDYWVLKDPISLKYFRFEEEEYALLCMLDGTASPDQVKRQFDFQFAPQKITMQELYQFIGSLYRSALLISDSPNQGVELRKRGKKAEQAKFRSSLTNILAIRFKGFDPDRILKWMNGYTKWFFTWPAFICVLLLGTSALALLLTHFETFQNRLPSFQEFFAAKNWIWLALVMGATKVVHEFGHGLACKKFGGQCHEMGVMLLVLTPCLYANVSDSWMLPSKWKRAFIAAAGMYVELVLASIAVFVWWFSQPGMINQLALNVIFVSSVSTILFNANPLLRYDGYYILADVLEIPNLRQKASSILQRWVGFWLLGIEARPDPFLPIRKQWLFALYSVSAALYRWFITFAIFWFVYDLLEPYGLKLVGQGIAMMAIYGLLGMPLVKLYKFFSVPGRFGTVKPVRVALSTVLLAALVGAIMLIPIRHNVYCVFHVQADDAANVYVDVPGLLVNIYVEPNQAIQQGQPMIRLQSPELEETFRAMVGQVSVAQASYNMMSEAAAVDLESANQKPAYEAALNASFAKLQQREHDIQKLIVTAPVSGTLISPPKVDLDRSETGELGNWNGTPLEKRNLGAYLDRRTLVGVIVPDMTKLNAILAIDQSEVEFVQSDMEVEMLVKQLPLKTFHSTTKHVSPSKMKSVPKALSSQNGGDLLTTKNKEGTDVPESTAYYVSVPIDNSETLLSPGSTGVAKIHCGSQTIGWRLWRLACQTFRFNL